MADTRAGPLAGVRVIDLGHVVAGPFAGSLLGDFGAEVVKIEDPRRGDTIRELGPRFGGSSLWWKVAGRNKKSVAIDLRSDEGRGLLRALARRADVLIENFKPGTLERWEVGPEALHAENPRLVILRISGYGQRSSASAKPGYGRIGEAMSGVVNLTGEPDGSPMHVGFSLGDTTSGLFGAFGVLNALYAREETGLGDVIDVALYEGLFRMIEWQIPMAQKLGQIVRRKGNAFPVGYAVGGSFCAADGVWITISAATRADIVKLLDTTGLTDLVEPPGQEVGDVTEIDRLLRGWIGERRSEEVLELFGERGLAIGRVYDAGMMLEDEIFAERDAIEWIDDPEIGTIAMPSVVPRLEKRPGSVRWAGPRLGEHTREILGDWLEIPEEEIQRLARETVVYIGDDSGVL